MPVPSNVWGYEIREPYPSEMRYLYQNRHVGGMATEDGRIILNPHSGLSEDQLHAVAKNEAARLYMRQKNFQFDFDPEPHQIQAFRGTPYENDPEAMKATILSRALSGDPSAGQLNARQQQWVDWLLPQLEGR
jgi:hypothetical protein